MKSGSCAVSGSCLNKWIKISICSCLYSHINKAMHFQMNVHLNDGITFNIISEIENTIVEQTKR